MSQLFVAIGCACIDRDLSLFVFGCFVDSVCPVIRGGCLNGGRISTMRSVGRNGFGFSLGARIGSRLDSVVGSIFAIWFVFGKICVFVWVGH